MGEQEISELLESLSKVNQKFGLVDEDLTGFVQDVEKLSKHINKQTDDFDKEFKKLTKGLQKGTAGYKEQESLINRLNDAIEEQIELAEKAIDGDAKQMRLEQARNLQIQKQELEKQAAWQKTKERMEDWSESSAKAVAGAAGNFVRGLQSGTSASQLVAGILTTSLDVAGGAMGALSEYATAAGGSLMMIPHPAAKVVGGLFMLGGALGDFMSGPGKELAKFGVTILAKQIDMTVAAFNTVARSGAMFATGLDGVTNAATESFLTIEQFSKVIETNSHNIAMSGLGFTQALNRVAQVQNNFAKGTNPVRQQLLKLGYGFEEQTSLIFETMADMRRGGLLARASDAQIAQQTKEYAENLRVISAITGEDARKRMEQARTQMQNMAIQQKILELQRTDPEAYQKMAAQLSTMPAEMQKMYLQKFALGTVSDPLSAAMMAQVPEMERAIDAQLSVVRDSTKNTKDATDEAAKQRAVVRQGMERNMNTLGVIGQAGIAGISGLPGELSQAYGSIFEQLSGATKETADKARQSQEAAMNATGKLTDGMMIAATEAQKLALALQTELLPLMEGYAKITADILRVFREEILKLGIGPGAVPPADIQALKDQTAAAKQQYEDIRKRDTNKSLTSQYLGIGDTKAERDAYKRLKDAEKAESDYIVAKRAYTDGLTRALKQLPSDASEKQRQQAVADYNKKFYEQSYKTAASPLGFAPSDPSTVFNPAKILGMDKSKNFAPNLTGPGGLVPKKAGASDRAAPTAALTNLENEIYQLLGSNFNRVTSENDLFHAKNNPESAHLKGRAFDFTLADPTSATAVVEMLKKRYPNAKIINEYDPAQRSSYASQGHIHMQFAKGGIASGSVGGYSATLHGTEAVVPLPDNKTIPVTLDSSSLTHALDTNNGLLNRILETLNTNNKMTSGILQNTY